MTEGGFNNPLDAYPSGVIVWYHGNTGDIPTGWFLCDGNNGTPNLLGKFLRSVPDTTTDPGGTGGSNSITLASGQLPGHNHTGTASTDDPGNHRHDEDVRTSAAHGAFRDLPVGDDTTYTFVSAGSHTHSIDTNSSVGSGNSINNMPRHVKLIPIQKG